MPSFLLLSLLVPGLRGGSYTISYGFILRTFRHYNLADPAQLALMELRLPRLLLAWLAGASRAVSGYLLQALVINSLADPYLLGTASGASLGVIASCVLVPPFTPAGAHLPLAGALQPAGVRGAGWGLPAGLRPVGAVALPAGRVAGGAGHGPVWGPLLRIFAAENFIVTSCWL